LEDENGVGSPFNDSDLHYDDDESQGSVYDAARPYVYYLAYEDRVARTYERVFKAEEEQETDYSIGTRYFSARFEVPNRSPATAATLLESFLPDKLLDGRLGSVYQRLRQGQTSSLSGQGCHKTRSFAFPWFCHIRRRRSCPIKVRLLLHRRGGNDCSGSWRGRSIAAGAPCHLVEVWHVQLPVE
jgi:hypothetical protein